MRQIQSFLKYRFHIEKRNFKWFFWVLFGTTILSYVDQVFVFLPKQILGFNWSGIAWLVALIISITLLPRAKSSHFPLMFWLPWLLYIIFFLIFDFSLLGLQLTLQYLLPILMGYIASSFRYSYNSLLWLLQRLSIITIIVFSIVMFYVLVFGFTGNEATTPMFLLVLASISLALYLFTKKYKYLTVYGLLFLMPLLVVTRMALLVFGITFIFHFANKRLSSRIGSAFWGGIMVLGAVNSKGFQEKTFYEGSGDISELSFNYYETDNINSNGRKNWKIALEPGLQSAPFFGNGPRADAVILGEVIGKKTGEAHNDYMSVRFNYGFLGLGLLLFGFGASFLKIFQMSKANKNKVFQLLVLTNLTLFIGFLLFMYSDNILKYTIWFPNYFFVLMGVCFSIYKRGFDVDGRM